MKKNITLLLFSLALIASTFGQNRMVLYEEFTSTTCGPCASQNPGFDALLQNNLDKATSIKYHMSWPAPGNDPYYLDNQSENNNRRAYYGVNSVPHVQGDGNYWSGQPGNVSQGLINQMANIASPFDMQVQTEISSGNDTIFVTTLVKAVDAITVNLLLHNVVIEKHLYNNPGVGNNGEHHFYNVMKKMLPSASGTQLNAPMNDGDYVIEQYFWALDYIYDIDELAVVSFIQNNVNKEVFQAALSSEDDITPVYSLDAEVLSVKNVTETNCFGTLEPKVTIRNNGQTELTSITLEYSVNGGEIQTADWSGNLSFLETAEISLDEITFDVLENNELEIVGINPNGSTDDYEVNNTFVHEFTRAPNLSGAVNLFMMFDDNPEETTWELFNSAGEVIQSGGPYSTPGGMKIETLEVSTLDCYELIMYDAGGNGMCCNAGDGYYAVIYGNNLTAFEGASFEDIDRNQFNYDPVGVDENMVFNQMNIYPNPTGGLLNINFNLFETSDVNIQVFDLRGKMVFESERGLSQTGDIEYRINLEHLNPAVYLIKLNVGKDTFVKKITVQ
jgi:hypothetical protein